MGGRLTWMAGLELLFTGTGEDTEDGTPGHLQIVHAILDPSSLCGGMQKRFCSLATLRFAETLQMQQSKSVRNNAGDIQFLET